MKSIPNDLLRLYVKVKGDCSPCFKYLSKEIIGKRFFTLLVIDETKCGKTTLMDVFVNYLARIKHEDPFRYKFVNENAIKDRPWGECQSNEIN